MKDLKYLLAYIVPISTWIGFEKLGYWVWMTPIIVFGIIPIFDLVFPLAKDNESSDSEPQRIKNIFFDILLYVCPFICCIIAFYYFQLVESKILSNGELIGLTLSTGLVLGSMGINVAHELGHRNHKFEVLLSKLGLMLNLYMHFTIEHNRGHHKIFKK